MAQPPKSDSTEPTGGRLRTYVAIGVVLAVLTAVEIRIPYWFAGDQPLIVTWLLIGAMVKAGFVMLYYMHLKFDNRVYSGIVLLALVLMGVFLTLLVFATMTGSPAV